MAKTSDQIPLAPQLPFRMRMRNIILSLQLRFPLHTKISQTLLLLIFRGRKSGKKYSFPVGYILEGRDDLIVLTPKKRIWWKNFRHNAPVTVYVQGRKRQGIAEVLHDDHEAIAQGITTFLGHNPQAAPMYRVELDASGKPTSETLHQAISHWTAIRIHLV